MYAVGGLYGTYGTDSLCHLRHAHNHRQTPPAECGHGELVLDVAEFRRGVEYAHVVQLAQELALHLATERVLRGQQRKAVGVRAEGTAQFVVPE